MATYNGHQEDSEGNILLPTPHSYAPIELGTTASQAYTKGKLMVYNNRLCQAKTSIASGATLTIGTNIEYTDMDTQLNNVKVYVGGSDSKLHFVDHAGADTALNFNPIQTGGTFPATTRNSQIDMGQRNTYRYVNTSNVPNNNTQTTTITSRSSSIDLGGTTHNIRYVNTTGVPNELKATSLWSRSYPNTAFAAQTITLNQSMQNFDYLVFVTEYWCDQSECELPTGGSVMVSVSDFTNMGDVSSPTKTFALCASGGTSLSDKYVRFLYHVSNTQIKFSGAYRMGTTSVFNNFCQPSAIIGLK